MNRLLRSLPSLALPIFFLGCQTENLVHTRITNLTPSSLPRNPANLYLVEADWESNQRSIIEESFQPQVKVGQEYFPMNRHPNLDNRWEAMIPVSADKSSVPYQYKFDYQYRSIPEPRLDSKLSKVYSLKIQD